MSTPPAEQTDENVSGLFKTVCVCVCGLKVYGALVKDKDKRKRKTRRRQGSMRRMTSNTARGSVCDQFSPPEGAQSLSDDPPAGQMESF